MGVKTAIEWTHHTFNPWRGCDKVHAGCTNCYAEANAKRNPKIFGVWGANGTREIASESMWREPLKWDRAAKAAGERRRVFCASLADVFEDRSDLVSPRERLLELIGSTPNLDWLLLTKRPQNVDNLMSPTPTKDIPIPYLGGGDYLPNVWLGTSVSNQETADEFIPHLLNAQASLRFLSIEPLLGPVDLHRWLWCGQCGQWLRERACGPTHAVAKARGISWVIVGGESGPHARPCDVEWIRGIVEQCKAAGVPVFVKQFGARAYGLAGDGFNADGSVPVGCYLDLYDKKGGELSEWPEDLRVRQFPEVRA